jgi:hypothetical protein
MDMIKQNEWKAILAEIVTTSKGDLELFIEGFSAKEA